MSTPAEAVETERMQCMEVWGGNSPTYRSFDAPGLQFWVHSRPYEGAKRGGDVYYASSCASGRITRLLLADVSGHGESVASVAAELRDLMKANVNVINQTTFVRAMNEQFLGDPNHADFATAVVCTFFAPTRTLQFCNAGHPPPLLFRADQGLWSSTADIEPVEHLEGFVDTPLGVVEGANYSRFETKLADGDMMLCLSDAFIESLDENGEFLGADGILRIVQGLNVEDPTTLIRQLRDRVVAEDSANLSQDDATILLLRADGSKVTLRDNLLAPLRLLRAPRDNTQLRV